MQSTQMTEMNRFSYYHLGVLALALSLVVSALTVVTTLAITGDLPGQEHSAASAPTYAQDNLRLEQSAVLKEARQEAIELAAGQHYGSALMIENRRLFYEGKEARQEAAGVAAGQHYGSELVNEHRRLFFEGKEAQQNAAAYPQYLSSHLSNSPR